MPALNFRRSFPIPLLLSHNLSRTPSAAGAVAMPPILRPSPAAKACPSRLALNSNTQQHFLLMCSLRRGVVGGGPTLAKGARLALPAHVKAPRIKPSFPSSSSSSPSSDFPPFAGGSLISGNSDTNRTPPLCRLSFSSSASSDGRGAGDSDSRSGSEVPGMGQVHKYGVDLRRNGDGSPRLSLKSSDKEKLAEEAKAKEKYARLLTLPTVLTLARVVAVPAFVCTFYVNSWWGPTTTTSIFIVAAITDWLDGYLARKMQLGTAFGAFLDPVADKLMVAATLVLLCSRPLDVPIFGDAPWLFPVPSIAIIGREITMSAVREWAASQKGKLSEAVAVNNLGKWKTATQMIALTILLACRDTSFERPEILVVSGVVLLYISAWLAIWSLIVYMRNIWKFLLK